VGNNGSFEKVEDKDVICDEDNKDETAT